MERSKYGGSESRSNDSGRGRERTPRSSSLNRRPSSGGSGRGDDGRRSSRERERSRGRTSATTQPDARYTDRRGRDRSLDRSHRTQRSQERSPRRNSRRDGSPSRRPESPPRRHSSPPRQHISPPRRASSPSRRNGNVSPARRNHSPQPRRRSPRPHDKRSPNRPQIVKHAPSVDGSNSHERSEKIPATEDSQGRTTTKEDSRTVRQPGHVPSTEHARSREATKDEPSEAPRPSVPKEARRLSCDRKDVADNCDTPTSRARSADDRHKQPTTESLASDQVAKMSNARDYKSSEAKSKELASKAGGNAKDRDEGSKSQGPSVRPTEKKDRVRFADDAGNRPSKSRWSSGESKAEVGKRKDGAELKSNDGLADDRKDKSRANGDSTADGGNEPEAKKQRRKKEEKPVRPPRPVYSNPKTEAWAQSWTLVWQKHRDANRIETKCLAAVGDVDIASFMVSLAESELAMVGQRIQAHEARLQQRERDGAAVDGDLIVLPPSPSE